MDDQETCDCPCALNHGGVGACLGRPAVPGLTLKAGKPGETLVRVCAECHREIIQAQTKRAAAQFAALPPQEQRVAALRLKASLLRAQAHACDMEASMLTTAGKMRGFLDMLDGAVARDVATHPDLAELNVLLNSMYDDGESK
ncbi:hypothetical protein ACIO3O_36865 [Streptomyces sp. NPDC087440]|uniref:hypothetical protein n=1 Tax=Streptomyces sp. NPDC087440 TaxID=3365790 RepID=UPI003801E6BD